MISRPKRQPTARELAADRLRRIRARLHGCGEQRRTDRPIWTGRLTRRELLRTIAAIPVAAVAVRGYPEPLTIAAHPVQSIGPIFVDGFDDAQPIPWRSVRSIALRGFDADTRRGEA